MLNTTEKTAFIPGEVVREFTANSPLEAIELYNIVNRSFRIIDKYQDLSLHPYALETLLALDSFICLLEQAAINPDDVHAATINCLWISLRNALAATV